MPDSKISTFIEYLKDSWVPDSIWQISTLTGAFIGTSIIIYPSPSFMAEGALSHVYFMFKVTIGFMMLMYWLLIFRTGLGSEELWESARKHIGLFGIGGLLAFVLKSFVMP